LDTGGKTSRQSDLEGNRAEEGIHRHA
jgi:hypothetical protein